MSRLYVFLYIKYTGLTTDLTDNTDKDMEKWLILILELAHMSTHSI
ncbi:hypothetical protein AGMMS49940_24020 [Spirochaetia bacterium]|nr:hypothetical protein AGMMS49940_24020 [Spirochaetia bacterium]